MEANLDQHVEVSIKPKQLNRDCSREIQKLDPITDNVLIELPDEFKNKIKMNLNGNINSDLNQSKDFLPRNSPLTDLSTDRNCRAVFNTFVAIFVLLLLSTVLPDLANGKINLGLYPIEVGLGGFPPAALIWFCMQLSTFGLYYGFKFWAEYRALVSSKLWNWMWLIGFIVYQLTLCVSSCFLTVKYKLPIACSIAVLFEMARFLMKNHSFVRTTVPGVLLGNLNSDSSTNIRVVPPFSCYVYFLFAPTLLYRNKYPRSKSIRWNFILNYCIQFIFSVWFMSLIFDKFAGPYFGKFGIASIDRKQLIQLVFCSLIPGTLILLDLFYMLIHCWLNMFAELLRFSDRQFYREWWLSPSFKQYLCKWNLVVQPWLYTFVYKEMNEIILPGYRTIAELSVYVVSGFFHELIYALPLGFFYPINWIMFNVIGYLLSWYAPCVERTAIGNFLVLFLLSVGTGIQFFLYTMEYYARINCPIKGESWTEYFVPVSWSCNGIA